MTGVDVLEVGGAAPPPGRRRWRIAALLASGLVLGGLIVHGALAERPAAQRAAPQPSASPTFVPDPALARTAGAALPAYPGTVPPIGFLDAGTRFVGVYADTPGQRVQVDVACAGVGQVLLGVYQDGAQAQPTGPVLATATVPCSAAPQPVTVTVYAPPAGQYQLVLATSGSTAPAAGVLAWRLIPWSAGIQW